MYSTPDGHEWKNKKGLMNFLLLDNKWELKQKDVENQVFKKKLSNIGEKISQKMKIF